MSTHSSLLGRLIVISTVVLSAFALAITTATPATASNADTVAVSEEEAISLLQEALKDHGYQGDLSEDALRAEYERSSDQISPMAANGCSTPKVAKKLTKKWDRIFKPACDRHDRCYSPGSKTARKTCDIRFRNAMLKICAPRQDRKSCNSAAHIYYYSVRAFGKSHYKGKGDPS